MKFEQNLCMNLKVLDGMIKAFQTYNCPIKMCLKNVDRAYKSWE